MDQENPYSLDTVSSEEGGLNKTAAMTYRAVVVADKDFTPALLAGIKVYNDAETVNLTIDVSSLEEFTFNGVSDAMLNAIVSSSMPYTIARTHGFITVVFGYDSAIIPQVELTGALEHCKWYYADPNRGIVITSDGDKAGIDTQTGSNGLPVKILTHLLSAAAGYAAGSMSSSEE